MVRRQPRANAARACQTHRHRGRQNHRYLGRRGALLSGIVVVLVFGFRNIRGRLAEGSRTAVGGAILAAMNTASEYGFGAVIAALPGFWCCRKH